MKHKGFTLIEVMLAIAIASVLSGILLTSVFQSNQVIKIINNIMDYNITATALTHQLSKDIRGAFVPLSVQLLQKQKQSVSAKATPDKQDKKNKMGNAKKTPPKKPPEKKQKLPKIEKIFYSSQKNNNLDVLTFITNNPLQPYWSSIGQGSVAKRPTIKMVRVVYRLVPEDQDKPVSYKLLRQESEKIDFAKFRLGGDIRAFEIANNIKQVKTEYYVLVPKKTEGKKSKKPKLELKKMPTWNDGKLPGEQKTKISMTPHFAKLSIIFWDDEKKAEFPFEVMIPITPELPLREVKEQPKKQPKVTVKKGQKKMTAREKIDALLKKKQ